MEPYENLSLVDILGEEWVDAYGWDGLYHVSNLGRLKSIGRWVSTGRGGERWVKEIIRKQCLQPDRRLNCAFSQNSIGVTINIPVVIYQSFNPKVFWDVSTHCIMHKNKILDNNRLSNLKLVTISKSHSVNAEKGLLPHLYENHRRQIETTDALTHRICKDCGLEKDIEQFRRGSFECWICKNERQKSSPNYLKKRTKIPIDPIIFEDKIFTITRHFSNYIFEKYGIDQRTVERRLKAGYTLKQCSNSIKHLKIKKKLK